MTTYKRQIYVKLFNVSYSCLNRQKFIIIFRLKMSFNINNTGHELLYSTIDRLNFISNQLTRYLPIIFSIIGTIGFIGNLFMFLQPKLRKNTFCLYSLFGSICDILNLYINLLPNYIYFHKCHSIF